MWSLVIKLIEICLAPPYYYFYGRRYIGTGIPRERHIKKNISEDSGIKIFFILICKLYN